MYKNNFMESENEFNDKMYSNIKKIMFCVHILKLQRN